MKSLGTSGLPSTVIMIAIAGFAFRLVSALIFVDINSEFYWEYGEIVRNLHAGKGYSLFHLSDSKVEYLFDHAALPFPSAFMPPGYCIFLFPFFWIQDLVVRNLVIIVAQALLSSLATILMFLVCRRLFDSLSAVAAAVISAVLPEFVYASNSFSPVVLYHLGVLLIFLVFHEGMHLTTRSSAGLACALAALIYLRSEFILFSAAIIVIVSHQKPRTALMIGTIVIILLLPWQVRNSIVFGTFAPLTTNAGLNLYRGNNPVGIGAWGDDMLIEQLETLEPGNDFEIRMQQIFLNRALATFRDVPMQTLVNGLVKVGHLWVLNPNDERAQNPLYLFPWGVLLVLFFIGIWSTRSWKRHILLYLLLIHSSLVAFVFFALPRYQTMMKIAVIPFAAYGLVTLIRRFR